jgi:hypothetical protein
MIRTVCKLGLVVLFFGLSNAAHADEFHGNGSKDAEILGQSPSICNDPQIAKIEAETGTTARVYPPGPISRALETRFGTQPGVCNGTNGIVEFIPNDIYAVLAQNVDNNVYKPQTPQPNNTSGNRVVLHGGAIENHDTSKDIPFNDGTGTIDYNTYNPLKGQINPDDPNGVKLVPLYGKLKVAGQSEPIRFTVSEYTQIHNKDRNHLATIIPNSAKDGFISAKGYMRDPWTLIILNLVTTSGKKIAESVVYLKYQP